MIKHSRKRGLVAATSASISGITVMATLLLAAGPVHAAPKGTTGMSTTGWLAGAGRAVPPRPAVTLYSQNNGDAGFAVVSQSFGRALQSWDSVAADSFDVPEGQTWTIQSVSVTGAYIDGSGPAKSETLTFFTDDGGAPGAVVAKVKTSTAEDRYGAFRVNGITHLKLGPGQYWMSFQVAMPARFGDWGWMTRTRQRGYAATWENPADGFGTGCTAWQSLSTCFGAGGQGPDFMFALRGNSVKG